MVEKFTKVCKLSTNKKIYFTSMPKILKLFKQKYKKVHVVPEAEKVKTFRRAEFCVKTFRTTKKCIYFKFCDKKVQK